MLYALQVKKNKCLKCKKDCEPVIQSFYPSGLEKRTTGRRKFLKKSNRFSIGYYCDKCGYGKKAILKKCCERKLI